MNNESPAVSIVIPAFNEEKYLPETLQAVARSAGLLRARRGLSTEVVVVDNGSQDDTRATAASMGARVISEAEHNIARVRNRGAALARAEVLVFLDADTRIPEELLLAIHEAMAAPACLGGAVDTDYRPRKRVVRLYLGFWRVIGRAFGVAQGATQFCRRVAFRRWPGTTNHCSWAKTSTSISGCAGMPAGRAARRSSLTSCRWYPLAAGSIAGLPGARCCSQIHFWSWLSAESAAPGRVGITRPYGNPERVYTYGMPVYILLLALAHLLMLRSAVEAPQTDKAPAGKEYVSRIQAARKAKDAGFRNEKTSPLGIVAITRLDSPRITIGSSPEADLRLTARSVEPIHAVVTREEIGNGTARWLLKPVGGKVLNEQTRKPIDSAELRKGDRYLVGKEVVYLDQSGTFGEVLRVFDPRAEALTQFQGLSYFPVDPKFRVEAEVVPDSTPTPMTVTDTNGWSRRGWNYGRVRFELEGQELALQLWLFKADPGPKDQFFIAFRDQTNGGESYGGGRYLDVPFVKSGRTILDFNQAYNPFCAYNTGFACPIPPAENRLPVAIRAGEKSFSGH